MLLHAACACSPRTLARVKAGGGDDDGGHGGCEGGGGEGGGGEGCGYDGGVDVFYATLKCNPTNLVLGPGMRVIFRARLAPPRPRLTCVRKCGRM